MNRIRIFLGTVVAVVASRGALAQHAGHQMPTQASPGEAAISECVRQSQQGLMLIERTNQLLEEARQSNSPAKMRASMDELQNSLAEIKRSLAPCAGLGGSVPGVGAAQHSAMPHDDHSKTERGKPPAPSSAAEKTIDPVCGMEVDSKSSPRAEYEGKTYYFCSERDREKFLQAPERYVRRPKRQS